MLFNINNEVRVKLTDHGRKIHRAHFRKLVAQLPDTCSLTYVPPKEDENGWSEWQLWKLMEVFGPHIDCCCELSFATTIDIPCETQTPNTEHRQLTEHSGENRIAKAE